MLSLVLTWSTTSTTCGLSLGIPVETGTPPYLLSLSLYSHFYGKCSSNLKFLYARHLTQRGSTQELYVIGGRHIMMYAKLMDALMNYYGLSFSFINNLHCSAASCWPSFSAASAQNRKHTLSEGFSFSHATALFNASIGRSRTRSVSNRAYARFSTRGCRRRAS